MDTIIIILLLVLLVYITACAVLGRIAARTVVFARRVPPEETRRRDTELVGPEGFEDYDSLWERHDFSLPTHQATISGEYIINPMNKSERKKVAVICHGHTVSRAASVKYSRIFYELGYNIVIFDERYFGKSTARCCTLGQNESQDVKAVIAFARSIFGEDCFLCLHGESMGAATSLLLLDTEKPDFVVADCPFGNTRELMMYQLGLRFKTMFSRRLIFEAANLYCRIVCGYDMHRVNPIESVRISDVPICFIHGKDDDYVPGSHSEAMYAAARNPDSELHMIDGAAHARSLATDREGYFRIVSDFAAKAEKKNM